MKSFKEFKDQLPPQTDVTSFLEAIWSKWKASVNINQKDVNEENLSFMLEKGSSFENAKKNWTEEHWQIAKVSPGKINRLLKMRSRMSGNPFERNGESTNWYKNLIRMGHDPRI